MSARIWQDIRDAVWDVRPELVEEFERCRDSLTILAFLEEHFPLEEGKWVDQLMLKVPGMLRALP